MSESFRSLLSSKPTHSMACNCIVLPYYHCYFLFLIFENTFPPIFFRWQTLVGGLLLHASWKLGWVEISLASRSDILSWLPASALFVGIIYAGSRALSRLPIPVFLTVHNAAEVITCGFQKFVQKEVIEILIDTSYVLLLQFDPNGYLWAFIHLICLGKLLSCGKKSWEKQILLLCPSGDLLSALDFPFLYFYRFHSSCCASGLLGFFLMWHTAKLKSSTTSGQYAAWSFLAKEYAPLPYGPSMALCNPLCVRAVLGTVVLAGTSWQLLCFLVCQLQECLPQVTPCLLPAARHGQWICAGASGKLSYFQVIYNYLYPVYFYPRSYPTYIRAVIYVSIS
uniref:Transmembrane protein 241 n=1 Tax=Nothoprocta perdicaria TaxID=30464 RepID=A0A8C7EGK7_NOTPE